MAVQEQTPYIEYVANGTTKVFPLTFDCEDQDHLIITIDGDEPIFGSWLLIDGSVSFKIAPVIDSKIIFKRNSPFERTANYSTYNNSFRPEPVNKDFDRIWLKLQEMGLATWLLSLKVDKEIRDRIAADIYYYTLITKETDQKVSELKEYIEALVNNISGNEFLPILDKFIKTWSGRTQEEKNKDFITVEDYGAIGDGTLHKLSEKYSTLALAKLAYANISNRITSLDQSIDWAACQSAIVANSKVYAVKPVYVLNDALDIPKGHGFDGTGCDVWDFPSTTGKPNLMQSGTTLLFVGTPFKKYNVFGVTRNSLTGGVITNPSPNESEFSTYELTDFTNMDADGTTPATLKDLKCAVVLNEASNASLRDIRILKSHKGIDGYNDASLTGIGDDYDIGLLVLNASFCDFYNVQAVGYWKMFGGIQINSEHKNVGSSKMGEGTFNLYSKCYFHGLTGFGFRGADEHIVVSKSTNSFTVPYDTSNLIAVNDTLTDGGLTYKVVGLVVSGDLLTITTDGAVPNAGNTLRHVRFNFGVAGVQMRDCVITGLFHKSRLSAKDVGLSKNSCGLEISGGILRDIDLDNVHIFDGECIAFINNVDDVNFTGSYFEASGIKSTSGVWNPSGTRFIVNGAKSDSSAKYPIEGCKNLTIDQSSEVAATVDLHPYNDERPARYTDAGLFKPYSLVVDAHGSQTANRLPKSRTETIIAATGLEPTKRGIRFVDQAFNNLMRIDATTGRVLVGGGTTALFNSMLHVRTIADAPSATHDIAIDAPNAGVQYIARSGTGWFRNWVDSAGYLRWSYSNGQSSSYANQAMFYNTVNQEFAVNGIVRPTGDNIHSLGTALNRWSTVYSATGAIQTSDERLKQQFRSQSEREKLAAIEIKNSICLFKFNDAVDLKGDGARWHVGVKAQQVVSILKKHGLEPFDYAFICLDEWGEQEEIIETWGDEYADQDIHNESGEYDDHVSPGEIMYPEGDLVREAGSRIIQVYREAGSRYAIRYDELSMFILNAI